MLLNATEGFLLGFYIFGGRKVAQQLHTTMQSKTCMTIHRKAWMTYFLFKIILSFFKRSILGGIFIINKHLLMLDYHDCHHTL
jgi:hypothetical protein